MNQMFQSNKVFNQDISHFDFKKVTQYSNMFNNATAMSNENYCKAVNKYKADVGYAVDLGKGTACN